jgi:hypothetical protein
MHPSFPPLHMSRATALAIASLNLMAAAPAMAALSGQVLGGGAPIALSTVTLWSASAGAPKQLAQVRSGADGRFAFGSARAPDKDAVWYLVAQGGQPTANKAAGNNPAIAMMTVLGSKPPARVTINEFTTIASVWTHNQVIDGKVIKGSLAGPAHHRRQCTQLCRSRHGRLGHDHSGSAQQQRRRRQWLISRRSPACSPAAPRRSLPMPARSCSPRSDHTRRGGADRHVGSRRGHCPEPCASGGQDLRTAGSVLPGATRQENARHAFPALPDIRTKCLGVSAEVRRGRLLAAAAS